MYIHVHVCLICDHMTCTINHKPQHYKKNQLINIRNIHIHKYNVHIHINTCSIHEIMHKSSLLLCGCQGIQGTVRVIQTVLVGLMSICLLLYSS